MLATIDELEAYVPISDYIPIMRRVKTATKLVTTMHEASQYIMYAPPHRSMYACMAMNTVELVIACYRVYQAQKVRKYLELLE
jgi:hypothetical protein